MRLGRGQRDEFTTFYATAYPELVAQVLAITGDAKVAKVATDITLAKAWRSWPSLRQAPDPLVRARWSAVLTAAEQESSGVEPLDAVAELTGQVGEDAVVVAALQLLPPVQRRALVLHYMGGVTVNELATLSGSSAEHIELLLDDGFTTLAETLDWAEDDVPDETLADDASGLEEADYSDDLDLRFDWTAEALADTAARLPDEIAAPSPAAMLRRAALMRWSARAIPVAAGAACVAVAVIVAAQPGAPSGTTRPAIYAQNDNGGAIDIPALPTDSGPSPSTGPADAPHTAPMVRLRSLALTSLLDPAAAADTSSDSGTSSAGSGQGAPRAVSSSSSSSPSSSSSSSGGGTSAGGSSGAGTTGTGTTTTTSTTPTSTGTTGTPPSSTGTTPPTSTTVPPITTTQPPDGTTTPFPTITTDPTTTTQPVTTDPTTTQVVTTAPTTTQAVTIAPTTTHPVTTTPPVETTSVIPHTTITTPTSVIEITTTTIEPTTTVETTTADPTTADSSTDATTKAKSNS